MKKTLILFLVLTIISRFTMVSNAQWIEIPSATGYEQIYLEYAQKLDEDINAENSQENDSDIWDTDKAIAMVDFNEDKIPELIHCRFVPFPLGFWDSDMAVYIKGGKTIEKKIEFYTVSSVTVYLQGDFAYIPNYRFTFFDAEEGFRTCKVHFRNQKSSGYKNYVDRRDEEYKKVIKPFALVEIEGSYQDAMKILLESYAKSVDDIANGNVNKGDSSWVWADIDEAIEIGIIPKEMYGEDLTQNINRAEFAAIAYKLIKILSSYRYDGMTGSFDDIAGNVYEDYIRGVASLEITQGTGSKEGKKLFSPDLSLTREQLATMLCRTIKAAKKLEENIEIELDPSDAPDFADSYLISDYAKDYVRFLTKSQIMRGVDENHVAPLNFATREQAILLALRIYNAYDVLTGEQTENQSKLKLNNEVIEKLENTTVGNLVSGFEDKKYTLSEMFDILNINNAESVAFDELGLLHCYAFDWNDYNITIYCYNENGPSYGCSVEADDFVKIASHKIKKLTLSDTEVIMKVGEDKRIFADTHTNNWYKIEWLCTDEDILDYYGGLIRFENSESLLIVARKPGTAYITAQVNNGDETFTSTCKVIINN